MKLTGNIQWPLSTFWGSKVKVTAGRRGGEDIHVDTGASNFKSLIYLLTYNWACSGALVLDLRSTGRGFKFYSGKAA